MSPRLNPTSRSSSTAASSALTSSNTATASRTVDLLASPDISLTCSTDPTARRREARARPRLRAEPGAVDPDFAQRRVRRRTLDERRERRRRQRFAEQMALDLIAPVVLEQPQLVDALDPFGTGLHAEAVG